MNRHSFFPAAALALLIGTSMQANACEALRPGPTGVVTSVTDGDTVILGSGRVVRLIGIQAPKLPLGRAGFPTWPLAEDAKHALENMALGKDIELGFGGEVLDRHGRTLAHMFVTKGANEAVWVQEAMIEAGLARVYSFSDNRFCLEALYAAEGRARAARRGIWRDDFYALRRADRPNALLQRVGQYELVEGRVVGVGEAGGRTYLNFGRYWKEDFTVVIEARARKLFVEAGHDLTALEGALVRVRGWVDDYDGPRIDVTHPEQIEVLALR